jgi:hypothetical protein
VAIKGKKKSGSRGSQARRRPASAPRPVAVARKKEPWYHTSTGRVIAAILVTLIIAAIGSAIVVARGNANEEKDKREAVEDHVDELTSIVQSVAPAAGAMAQITGSSPPEQLAELDELSKGWIESFEGAAGRLSGATPPEEVAQLNQFYTQSMQLYLSAARLMGDAAALEGKARADVLTRATEIRAQAEGIWTSTTALLDEELTELGGDPSGLQSPGVAGASAAVPTAPSAPEGEGNDGGGGQSTP